MGAWIKRIARWLMLALLGWVAFSVLMVLMLRVVPLSFSTVMLERKLEAVWAGESMAQQQQWRPLKEMSLDAQLAVIASEDQRFPFHRGVDFVELRRAIIDARRGNSLRGASTLSQQTAKNLFLWSGRSWVRKVLEAWFTLLIEALWPKERILEVYLNIAEWDNGVFGLEAASRAGQSAGRHPSQSQGLERLASLTPRRAPRAVDSPADAQSWRACLSAASLGIPRAR
jgi:monofunctional biosynthetic peptidoglycan transglycosylase